MKLTHANIEGQTIYIDSVNKFWYYYSTAGKCTHLVPFGTNQVIPVKETPEQISELTKEK